MFSNRTAFIRQAATLATLNQRSQRKQQSQAKLRRTSRKRLRFERLETRRVLASVVSVSPSLDGGILPTGSTSLTLIHSETVLVGNNATNVELRNQGPDGILGNADDELVSLRRTYAGNTTTLDFPGLIDGVYRLAINDSELSINPLAGITRRDFVVTNFEALSPKTFLPEIGSDQIESKFGSSVAIDGNLRVVGAPLADFDGSIDVGVVYVFDTTSGGLLATLKNPNTNVVGYFGSQVAISGNVVVVGSPYAPYPSFYEGSGNAYLFNATTGLLIAELSNPTPKISDYFGYGVAISGNTVVVGAPGGQAGAAARNGGVAHVYDVVSGSLVATLNNPTPAPVDQFGLSVSVSGNIAVVGALGDDTTATDSGTVYLFNATTGALAMTLANPTPAVGDGFGTSVSIFANTVAVGSPNDDTRAEDGGTAYVFNATTGALVATLVDPRPFLDDRFGSSLAISGNKVAVGVAGDNVQGRDAGSVYLFDSATGTVLRRLASPKPEVDGRFAASLAISGNNVIIGANQEDKNNSKDSGSAYVFDASTGALAISLQNPTGSLASNFGSQMALTENRFVVGTGRGEVYLFDRDTERLVAKLADPSSKSDTSFGRAFAASGNTVVVSGYAESGVVYVYNAVSGELVSSLTIPESPSQYWFGVRLAVYENTICVGGFSDKVYLFDASTGALRATLSHPNAPVDNRFGYALAISGSKVVVGDPFNNTGANFSGCAFVFDANTGELRATLVNPTPATREEFGSSLAISDNIIVVSAREADVSGMSRGIAYTFNANNGQLIATLPSPIQTGTNNFGYSLGVSGNNVVIGDYVDDSLRGDSGIAHVFNATTGSLVASIANPTPKTNDNFGFSVAILGNAIALGARNDDTVHVNQGAAYLFTLDPQNLITASGRSFEVNGIRFGAGQFIQGTNNAFDGLNRLQVNGVDFSPLASQLVTQDDTNRTVITPAVTIGGLSVSREITVPDTGTEDFARTVDKFANSTVASITVPVRIVGNLGSDAATVVFATSDGDTIVEPSDSWFATDDADASGAPAIVHVFREPGSIQPTRVEVVGDNVVMEYLLTIPAGKTVSLAHFTALADTRSKATADVAKLISFDALRPAAAVGLTTAEKETLANFTFHRDYGDAPLPYPASASHVPVGPRLGATRDVEPRIRRNVDGDGGDEDGVRFGRIDPARNLAAVNIDLQNASQSLIDAWIDFNQDGDWNDVGEKIFNSSPVTSGMQTLNFTVPSSAKLGGTHARVRVSTSGGLAPTWATSDGEVEDYAITIDSSPVAVVDTAINNDKLGRSDVTSIKVQIDSLVPVRASDFVLLNTTTNTVVTGINVQTSPINGTNSISGTNVINGSTTVTLTFTGGPSVVASNHPSLLPSLANGNYTLRYLPSESSVSAAPIDAFFRKYGDVNGDNIVSLSDYAKFRASYGGTIGDSRYDGGLDFNRDGLISLVDFAAFRAAYGR
jgi:hypothetical protein